MIFKKCFIILLDSQVKTSEIKKKHVLYVLIKLIMEKFYRVIIVFIRK